MPLLISGSLISPVNLTSYKSVTRALVYVDDKGIIKFIGEHEPAVPIEELAIQLFLDQHKLSKDSVEIIRLEKGQFIIPGFIDTHTVRVYSWVSQTC